MSYFQQLFRSVVNGNQQSSMQHLPMLNSVAASYSPYINQIGQIRKKKALISWYKGIPELTGLVNKVARDIVGQWHFEGILPNDMPRNKLLSANKFAAKVQLNQLMTSQVIDQLVTGEAFGWLARLPKDKITQAVEKCAKDNFFIENKEQQQKILDAVWKDLNKAEFKIKGLEGITDVTDISEEILKPRRYRYLPSSTVEIVHDQHEVLGYKHIVGMNEVNFTTDEVVHYRFFDVDGKPNGFSPVESILVQLELLRFMWQNMLAIHKNGGSMDKIVSLKNIQPNSESYKRIEQQLQKYKLVENRHGMMLFTGEIQVEDLTQIDKMQFLDMGLYITGVIAMQWQVPRSSIPFVVGQANTKDDTGGNSEKGYWENIEFFQKIYSETMNTQLWMPYFGVRLVFDRQYSQKDVQEKTALNWDYTNLQLQNSILQNGYQKRLKPEILYKKFGITEDDLEEAPMMEMSNTFMGNRPSDSEVNDSQSKKNKNQVKKDEQTATNNSRGKPTGMGKEFVIKEIDSAAELELKETIGSEPIVVDLQMFVKLYNEDKQYHPGKPPRVFMRRNEMATSFVFKSTDFVYKTMILNDQVSSANVLLMNLGQNIYRL